VLFSGQSSFLQVDPSGADTAMQLMHCTTYSARTPNTTQTHTDAHAARNQHRLAHIHSRSLYLLSHILRSSTDATVHFRNAHTQTLFLAIPRAKPDSAFPQRRNEGNRQRHGFQREWRWWRQFHITNCVAAHLTLLSKSRNDKLLMLSLLPICPTWRRRRLLTRAGAAFTQLRKLRHRDTRF
jgi:hypothetical protein